MDPQQINTLIQQIRTTSASVQALMSYIRPMFRPHVNALLDFQNRLLAPNVVETLTDPVSVVFSVPSEQLNASLVQWNANHATWVRYLQILLEQLQGTLRYAESEMWVRQSTGTMGFVQDFQQSSADQWTNLWENHQRIQRSLDRSMIDILGGHGCSACDVQPCPCPCFPSYIQGALCINCGHLGH